jgi:hypothetical protein
MFLRNSLTAEDLVDWVFGDFVYEESIGFVLVEWQKGADIASQGFKYFACELDLKDRKLVVFLITDGNKLEL